jgi:hypothetical protein
MEQYGTIWNNLEQYGTIWSNIVGIKGDAEG